MCGRHTPEFYVGWLVQIPAHDGLAYLNKHVVDDVIKHEGVTVHNLPITHTKSSDRWRKVGRGCWGGSLPCLHLCMHHWCILLAICMKAIFSKMRSRGRA